MLLDLTVCRARPGFPRMGLGRLCLKDPHIISKLKPSRKAASHKLACTSCAMVTEFQKLTSSRNQQATLMDPQPGSLIIDLVPVQVGGTGCVVLPRGCSKLVEPYSSGTLCQPVPCTRYEPDRSRGECPDKHRGTHRNHHLTS